MKRMYQNLTWNNGIRVRLGVIGNREAVIPQEIANCQEKYNDRAFKALLSDGTWMSVKLKSKDYGISLHENIHDILVQPLRYCKKR